ncbi:hypothetical protein DPMN_002379 [Dreissena polymorpha]|uniref:Uncharacterized protein n=1 Tax=Dreissena polymorpha TaxID=45954 RepID=A0A9D4ML68_DREPO|nr:hypothetical protein DPMN_002379 [Dreissena polymorpha]
MQLPIKFQVSHRYAKHKIASANKVPTDKPSEPGLVHSAVQREEPQVALCSRDYPCPFGHNLVVHGPADHGSHHQQEREQTEESSG